jgi:hypothetical protein
MARVLREFALLRERAFQPGDHVVEGLAESRDFVVGLGYR